MKKQGLKLTHPELLSLTLYCDADDFCYEMRKSQREQDLNSCEWKHLFYHLFRLSYHVLYSTILF